MKSRFAAERFAMSPSCHDSQITSLPVEKILSHYLDVGYIDKRIASLRKTGCQGILLRGEGFFIEVDAKALNPLKTTSIHNAARMVESCATNPIRGGPARKPT